VSNWKLINEGRCRSGQFASQDSDGCNDFFRLLICSEWLNIIASDGEGWKHVSVSRCWDGNKVPTWQMMCVVKDLFFEPEGWVVQFHPAESEYVNNHPGCLHLWKPDAPFPTPPSILTGIK
jgi:hypothetical protein